MEKRREGRPEKLAQSDQVSRAGGDGRNPRARAEHQQGIRCARWQYAPAVDTLAEASPTIKRKILSGEISQTRGAIAKIAAKPEAERVKSVERMERGEPPEPEIKTKACRS